MLKIAHTEEKAYALNNPQEYFAEATEAFFGTNDFYPFVQIGAATSRPRGLRAAQEALGRKVRPRDRRATPGTLIQPLTPITGIPDNFFRLRSR